MFCPLLWSVLLESTPTQMTGVLVGMWFSYFGRMEIEKTRGSEGRDFKAESACWQGSKRRGCERDKFQGTPWREGFCKDHIQSKFEWKCALSKERPLFCSFRCRWGAPGWNHYPFYPFMAWIFVCLKLNPHVCVASSHKNQGASAMEDPTVSRESEVPTSQMPSIPYLLWESSSRRTWKPDRL